MTVPVFHFPEPAAGTQCVAGYRRVWQDATSGDVVSTVATWGCPETAAWVVTLHCPSCGHRVEAPYCARHTAEAVGGTVRCLFCPDVIAEAERG